MRKIILIAAIIVAALAVIAATDTDPLVELTQALTDLTTRVDDHETRLAYLERFQPIDTYEAIEGAGSTAELAAAFNSRILVADGIEIAVTGAKVIRKATDIRDIAEVYSESVNPPTGHELVSVNINIYNTSREVGALKNSICPYETHDTLATNYRGSCEESVFWNIEINEENYPLLDPHYGILAEDATVSQATLYFHAEAGRPLDGLLSYKHPSSEVSHRYWKLKRNR